MAVIGPGTLVTPNVRLVRLLADGGMGQVWLADHLTLRTPVAVKFVAPELGAKAGALERFRREAAAAAQLKTPFVVQILDHGVLQDDTPYIVMEKLDGETLAERLARVGTLSLRHTAQVVAQVAKALGRAHRLGIIHRDIKPHNIFLMESDDDEIYVKVLDFGIAKWADAPDSVRVTSSGAMVGTPGYMSPEQALDGRDLDPRTDLWSLGVVAYHALVGENPFAGETLGALCVSISQGKFTPPSERRPDLPAEIDTWMTHALAVERDRRFGTAKELSDAFDRAAAASPRKTDRPSPPVHPGVSVPTDRDEPADLALDGFVARRRRKLVVLGTVVGVIGSAAVAVMVLGRDSSGGPVTSPASDAGAIGSAADGSTVAPPGMQPSTVASVPAVSMEPSTGQPKPRTTSRSPQATPKPTTGSRPTVTTTTDRAGRDYGF